MAEVIVKDKTDSIEVSENAKGQFTFKVKLYFDADDNINSDIPMSEYKIEEAKAIYERLHKEFRGN